jgi:hypothetical protein
MPLCFCVLLNRTGDALVVLVLFFFFFMEILVKEVEIESHRLPEYADRENMLPFFP